MREFSKLNAACAFLASIALCGGASWAQEFEDFSYTPEVTNMCLETASTLDDRQNCASHAVGQCMKDNEGGTITSGL